MIEEQLEATNSRVATAITEGELIVYPTEAVMGIGCDPDNADAIEKLLNLKQRPQNKGLILVASSYSQLLPYVNDDAIRQDRRAEIFSSWPGPITWLLPKGEHASEWVTGENHTIAVRVTAHPTVRDICNVIDKPLVSTSANPTGLVPALTAAQAAQYFGQKVKYIAGEIGQESKPSTIKDGETLATIRG